MRTISKYQKISDWFEPGVKDRLEYRSHDPNSPAHRLGRSAFL